MNSPQMDKSKVLEIVVNFLRPKYYNRITWAVVVAGLGLVCTSLFELILNEILKSKFKINIISEQDGIYGVLLVFIGLTYNLAYHFIELKREELGAITKREETDRNATHDTRIFEESNKILNEDELDRILNQLSGGHETYMTEIKKNMDIHRLL